MFAVSAHGGGGGGGGVRSRGTALLLSSQFFYCTNSHRESTALISQEDKHCFSLQRVHPEKVTKLHCAQ